MQHTFTLTHIMATFKSLLIAILLAYSNAQSDTLENSTTTSTTSASRITTSTSPAPIPTTTLSPPVPAPENVPTWTVKSSNSTCLLLRGNFTFAVTYTTPAGNSVSDRVDIPPSAKASGSCGPFINSLVLTWDKSNLTFMFIKKPIYAAGADTGEGSYSLTTIFGRLTVENPNDGSGTNSPTRDPSSPTSTSSGQMFFISVKSPGTMSAPLHNSYTCESYQSLAADKAGNAYLEMRGVQLEAFRNGMDENFGESQICTKDTMSAVLPIVGYAALAALVAAGAGYLAWKKFGRSGYTEV